MAAGLDARKNAGNDTSGIIVVSLARIKLQSIFDVAAAGGWWKIYTIANPTY